MTRRACHVFDFCATLRIPTNSITDSDRGRSPIPTKAITLDGVDVTSEFTVASKQAVRLPAGEPMGPGERMLEVRVADVAGNVAQTTVTFEVTSDVPPLLCDVRPERFSFSPGLNPYEPPEKATLKIFYSPSKVVDVTLTVHGPGGTTVRTVGASAVPMGSQVVEFDGMSDSGVPLRPGVYELRLVGTDAEGRSSLTHSFGVRIFF